MTLTADAQRQEVENALGRVRQLQRQAEQLAQRLAGQVQSLQQLGTPIILEALAEAGQWPNQRLMVLTELTHIAACDECRPALGLQASLPDWEQALLTGIEECKKRASRESGERQSRRELITNLLELRTTGEAKYLDSLQQVARSLGQSLDADDWRTALCHEDWKGLEAFWGLVVDARDGKVDEPEALDRAQQVTDRFGLGLTLQAYGGRIRPEHDWPRTLSAVEAVSRLHLGQPRPESLKPGVDVAATLKSVAAAATDEFDRATLESVRTKAHQRAETSSRNGNALEAMCLDTLCQSIEVVLDVLKEYPTESEERRQLLRRGLQFVATSQSALRRVALTKSITGEDAEQSAIFGWLKRITRDHGVFIERHMKLEDVADPVQLPELRKEIEPLLFELRRPARIRKTLQRVEYKLGSDNEADARLRWEGVMRDIDTLILDEEVQPSHRELREVLLPFVDELPEDLAETGGMRRVLAEIDRYLADQDASEDAAAEQLVSAEVQAVAQALRGKRVVMIGGVPKPKTRDKIKEAFDLSDLVWERANEHESTQRFAPLVQAPDVALVLVLIRWVGHGHAEDIKVYCQSARKPFVFVPRGYNVNQLAHDIIAQRGQMFAIPPLISSN